MSPLKLCELPENVVRLRPDVVVKWPVRRPTRPKKTQPGTQAHLITVTPDAPGLITKTTSKRGKKPKPDRMITMTSASLQLEDDPTTSSSLLTPAPDPEQVKTAFRRLVRSLGATELRDRFPLEAASHSNMKARRKTHGAVIHPAFEDFGPFLLHVGPRPLPTWTLDRVNPHDPEYAPGKVRWADKRSQANNRRNTIMLTARDETRPLTDWARRMNQDPKTLRARLDRGWTHEEVVFGKNPRPTQADEQPASAPKTEGYVWPGTNQDLWEQGFRGFVAFARTAPTFRGFPDSAFTRDVFAYWIAGNITVACHELLKKRHGHAGYGQPNGDPDWQDPAVAQDDDNYRLMTQVFGPVRDRAWSRLRDDAEQLRLFETALKRKPVRSLPQEWKAVFPAPKRGEYDW